MLATASLHRDLVPPRREQKSGTQNQDTHPSPLPTSDPPMALCCKIELVPDVVVDERAESVGGRRDAASCCETPAEPPPFALTFPEDTSSRTPSKPLRLDTVHEETAEMAGTAEGESDEGTAAVDTVASRATNAQRTMQRIRRQSNRRR